MENNDVSDLGPRKKYAKDLAQKLLKAAKITAAPVSLQKVIEHLQSEYNLDVKKVVLSQKVSGLLVVCKDVDSEYATIGFNGTHPWCRRRFTLAHEIGHLLLGHTCNKNPLDGSHNEAEANAFASELLIPTSTIKQDFKKSPKLPDLCLLYRVSQEAMTYKLMETRLV